MNRNNFRKELLKKCKTISILDVASKRMEVSVVGKRAIGLCPFHDDKNPNSFSLDLQKNRYICYACGVKGDVIDFVSNLDGTSVTETTLNLAEEYQILSSEQIEEFKSKKEVQGEMSKGISNVNVDIKPTVPLDMVLVDKVYQVFSRGNTLIGGPKLSKAHLDKLRNERGLSDKEIEDAGFFTFPSMSILKSFYQHLYSEFHLTPFDVKNVPGLFWGMWNENKVVDSDGSFGLEPGGCFTPVLFQKVEGIGFPLKDASGKIIAIQYRNDKAVKGQPRYKLFSTSQYAGEEGDKRFGANSGAPQDVSFPNSNRVRKTLFITEGKFKALAINRFFNSATISAQGVCSITGIESQVNEMKEAREFRNIMVAFDGDSFSNDAVFGQLMKLCHTLEESTKLPVYLAIWEKKFGKGIDDVILNHNENKLMSVDFDVVSEELDGYLEKIRKMPARNGGRQKVMIDVMNYILSNNTKRAAQ